MPAMLMVHEEDPAKLLFKKLGKKIKNLEVFNNQCLGAIYERPAVTKGGVHLTKQYLAEEQWQGKAVLLIAKGESAFKSDGQWFTGATLSVGDWLVIRPSEGLPLSILGDNGEELKCRLFNDTATRMRIASPDEVW